MNRMSSAGADPALRVGPGGVAESPDDVDQAVGLAERSKTAASLTSPKEAPARSVSSTVTGTFFFSGIEAGDGVEPVVGEGPGADVRLLPAVSTGPRPGSGAREQAEEGRLSRLPDSRTG